ncbi:MAG TPA: hypothetical protein VFE98_11495 [Candidatus Bathyarchaeia archaeon]|nr:hypothetical protein [Candidatus Bathyarchaeia archaeon]
MKVFLTVLFHYGSRIALEFDIRTLSHILKLYSYQLTDCRVTLLNFSASRT